MKSFNQTVSHQSRITLIFVFFIVVLCGCAKRPSNESDLAARDSTQESQASKIGFFYFELTPTSALPFYFSDVKVIKYANNIDLSRQQDEYMLKLRAAAASDGQDPNNYNQKSSIEKSNFKDAEDERQSNMKQLTNSGTKVIEKTLP